MPWGGPCAAAHQSCLLLLARAVVESAAVCSAAAVCPAARSRFARSPILAQARARHIAYQLLRGGGMADAMPHQPQRRLKRVAAHIVLSAANPAPYLAVSPYSEEVLARRVSNGVTQRGTGLGGGQPGPGTPYLVESMTAAQRAQVDATTASLREEGWALVRDIIAPEAVAAVRDSTLATLARRDELGQSSELARRVAGSWLSVNQALAPYCAHPQILGVMEQTWSASHSVWPDSDFVIACIL
eukprot:SAG31_NODE_7835_length_1586_cov_1.302623_1_plen_243_part_00